MVVKGEKITDENHLKSLEKARAIALENRRKKAEEKVRIKMANQMEHKIKLHDAEEKIKKLEEIALKKGEKKKKKQVVESSSSESESSESEEEEEEHIPPPTKVKKHKQVARQPVITPRSVPIITEDQKRMMKLYKSLFGE